MIKTACLTLLVGLGVYCYLFFGFDLAQRLWYANASNRDLKAIDRQIFKPVQALLPAGQKPLMILLPLKDPVPSPSDHLGPFREYMRQNYRMTKIFPNSHQVWEKIDSSGSGSSR